MTGSWKVVAPASVKRAIKSLRDRCRDDVREVIWGLAEDPFPSDAKELDGWHDFYRVYCCEERKDSRLIFTHRIIYFVNRRDRVIRIDTVGPRPLVYRSGGWRRNPGDDLSTYVRRRILVPI